MRLKFTDPVGVRITGLALAEADPGQVTDLRHLLTTRGVLVLPDQDVDDPAFIAFLRQFGELAFTAGETPVDGQPALNLISNVGRTSPPRSVFHVDTSYVRHPPAYTALRAVTVPDHGGETLFTNQYRAFATLPVVLRDHLAGRTVRHQVTGLRLSGDEEAAASIPSSGRIRSPATPPCTSPLLNAAWPSAAWPTRRPGPRSSSSTPTRPRRRTPTGTPGRRETW